MKENKIENQLKKEEKVMLERREYIETLNSENNIEELIRYKFIYRF